jgi:hypothetical protein
MAHFAELDSNNTVVRIIAIANKDTADKYGVEKEEIGREFCSKLLGGNWVQTSYNHNKRKRYAGIGMTYNETLDAFISPKPPTPSWILDETICEWIAPIPKPNDDQNYCWNEEQQAWELYILPVSDVSSLSAIPCPTADLPLTLLPTVTAA